MEPDESAMSGLKEITFLMNFQGIDSDAAEVSEPQNQGFLCCVKAWDVEFWAGKEGTRRPRL